MAQPLMTTQNHNNELQNLITDLLASNNNFLSMDKYFELMLYEPELGFYMTQDLDKALMDTFVTAPQICQVFGEIIGLYWIDYCLQNQYQDIVLMEIGPGTGRLMADMLNMVEQLPIIKKQIHKINMIEVSPALTKCQQQTLAQYNSNDDIAWHNNSNDVIGILDAQPLVTPMVTPLVVIANELLDALTARQLQYFAGQWYEYGVALDGQQLLHAVRSDIPVDHETIKSLMINNSNIKDGDIIEIPDYSILDAALQYIKKHGGLMILIDYGHYGKDQAIIPGDTMQAIHNHKYCNALDLNLAGHMDLTFHANFDYLMQIIKKQDMNINVVTQGDFLRDNGGFIRAHRLIQHNPQQQNAIELAMNRLVNEMGKLFKVAIISN